MRSRILPALMAALGVSFVVAGLLTYTSGNPFGTEPTGAPTAIASPAPTDSAVLPSASDGSGSPGPGPSDTSSPGPSTTASAFATGSALPSGSGVPSASASPLASASPRVPSATPAPSNRVATRVVIPALLIDLPVIRPPGNASTYPLCDVAMFIQSLSQPGRPGATYLYAHAREGMFLPILQASLVNNGKAMIGMLVEVYTSDDRYYLYQVSEVRRHQTTLNDAIAAKDEELWLQTSEGPHGTPGKLQVVALPLSNGPADPAEARPTPHPVVCG